MKRLMLIIGAVAAISLLSAPKAACGEEFVFENDLIRWSIGSDGMNKSLLEKKTGGEWLASNSRIAWVKKGGKTFAASAVARRGEGLEIAFGDSGVTADCRITTRPHYFLVELAAVRGEGAQEICFAQLNANISENIGGWIGIRWNDRFAVCLMGLSDRVNTAGSSAIVYPEFGMAGEKAAIIAVPTAQFLSVAQEVERDCRLPSPTLGGQWAKTSQDVRRGYLFTDLTEANADETIRYAKLGEFAYIMTYSGTWSTSLGLYPINLKNFPKGEESLQATIDKCHAAGLKVGMHMLTSFVSKNDPLVRPRPDPRLLKDAEAILAADIDAQTKDIPSAAPLDAFPQEHAYYGSGKQGMDFVIGDEIIQYRRTGGADDKTFLQCVRGYAGTKAAPHKAGDKIQHLCERYGSYLVDLKTPLKDELAERVAGVFNRCGFDMIYFDGGECNSANGPYWYWVSQQQMAVYQRVRRDILVQGSGGTAWTWHIFARGCCDDFAAVAPKQYLDYHKIADSWQHYTKSFMPADLGWWGFLDAAPHQPATSPDEVEYYAVRMLALDSPVSLETHLAALKKNGRTEELLRLLGQYERLRLSGKISAAVRERLRQGEWRLTMADGKPSFCPVRYDNYRAAAPGAIAAVNPFGAQPLKFRLQAVPSLAAAGTTGNISLLQPEAPVALKLPDAKAPMPGALAGRIEYTRPAGEQVSVFMVGPGARLGGSDGKALDLLKHRALAVRLRVDSPAPAAGEPCAVLNVQLEADGKTYRDHYIDLNITGEKTIVISEPTTERMLPEFRPANANYAFKAAMYGFNYQRIVALNLRWMRLSKAPVQCAVGLVEALKETEGAVKNPEIAVGPARLAIPAELKTGDYAESWADGMIRIFDSHGALLQTINPTSAAPTLAAGGNQISVSAASPAPLKLTLITLGDALKNP
ncbi:MAG: hypothetical protein NTX50_31930 [Candidatus Sumerlaeota bacterium]|nr:hypothetical protein [Candidatus Sumerlaeota bacterium]